MSYLHCPTCRNAYNVSQQPACPRCGLRPGAPADPTDDVVAAADQLARAIARATPAEIAAAEAVLDARASQLALPAGDALSATAAPPSVLKAVRAALSPEPPPPEPERRGYTQMFSAVAVAVLAKITAPRPRRLPPRVESMRSWATARFERVKQMAFARFN
jgi:hypothetical protein